MSNYIGKSMLIILSGVLLLVMSCQTSDTFSELDYHNVVKAIAVLHPTEGNQVSGTVTFSQGANGIKIVADVEGLTPGKHGFHIHELGDCSAADATSAGGHFNPKNKQHGAPDDFDRHAGDLGNLEANENGVAQYERVDKFLTFRGPNSIIGRAVIIHAGEDDFKTQPTGAAGARVACGVIGIAEVIEK